MPKAGDDFRVVVIGASAGGIEAVTGIVRALRPDLRAALFVVIHTGPGSRGMLPDLLDRASALTGVRAEDGAKIEPGHIYLPPPDYHLTLEDGRIRLNHGPRENGFRPAVDPLFRSAALAYGRRVVGVVLSGGLNDGTHGLLAIRRAGGLTVAQEPTEADNPGMPLSAIRYAEPAHVLTVHEIGMLLNRLNGLPTRSARTGGKRGGKTGSAAQEPAARAQTRAARVPARSSGEPGSLPAGAPTTLTCPECGGALWEQQNGALRRYECRVGHAFTDMALSSAQAERLEDALWVAVRVLEENASYLRGLAARSRGGRLDAIAARYEDRALDAEQRAALILDVLSRPSPEIDENGPPTKATPPATRAAQQEGRREGFPRDAQEARPRAKGERPTRGKPREKK